MNKYILTAVKSEYGFKGKSLSEEECLQVENISASDVTGYGNKSIWDFSAFPNLKKIDCSFNGISKIKVMNNPKLEYFDWQGTGPLPGLDLSHNSKLRTICGGQDGLVELDLSNNPEIENINIILNSGLRWINIDNCEKIKRIKLFGVLIPFVDLTRCKDLEYVEIHYLNTYDNYDDYDDRYGDGTPRPLIFVSSDFDENTIPNMFRRDSWFYYRLIRVSSGSKEMDALQKLKSMRSTLISIPRAHIASNYFNLVDELNLD